MSQLYLYMILHGNLNFSSIPKEQYSTVLDNCYWPMIDIIKKGCRIAVEFPASTLVELQKMDKSFIAEIKKLREEDQCEIIASCYTQAILPMIPYRVNLHNIQAGIDAYKKILGSVPKLFFLPEQTYSKSIPEILKKFNFSAMIMDWDNAAEYHHYDKELRYKPALVKTHSDGTLPVIWNSSMNSFKFQRYIYGRTSLNDYINGILEHFNLRHKRAFCIYGTDWEIYNFRPLTHEVVSEEIKRVKTIFDYIKTKERVSFCLPSELLTLLPPNHEIEIGSTEIPIPCKNRDDYNIIRWAVSGRDNVMQNTKCYELYNTLSKIESLDNDVNHKNDWTNLVKLWGSDYRTKTTSNKFHEFWEQMGYQLSTSRTKLFNILSRKEISEDLIITNCSENDFNEQIFEYMMFLPKGKYHHQIGLIVDGNKIKSQCEEIKYYQDKSIRQLRLVFKLSIKAKETKNASIYEIESVTPGPYTFRINGQEITVKTDSVTLELNINSGADVRSLIFNKISDIAMVKYLPPVYFDNISYSNDYFSGWTQLCDDSGKIFNDTIPTKMVPDQSIFSIRLPVFFKHQFADGFIQKRYDIYLNENRVDLTNHFYFPKITPTFLRTAITTINPECFDLSEFQYSTINGGKTVETYPLKSKKVNHSFPPSQQCSAISCIGSTDGWIALSDSKKGFVIATDKSELYSNPMLEFQEIKNKWLCRVYNSLAETDDTGKVSFQGHYKIKTSYLGYGNNVKDIKETVNAINKPLEILIKK